MIRGPHWQSGDADGGEGHLGTLRALLGNGQVRVLWDNGQEVTCKAGADGKYELRVIDTAPVGEWNDFSDWLINHSIKSDSQLLRSDRVRVTQLLISDSQLLISDTQLLISDSQLLRSNSQLLISNTSSLEVIHSCLKVFTVA